MPDSVRVSPSSSGDGSGAGASHVRIYYRLYILYNIHYMLYTIYCILHTIYYTLYTTCYMLYDIYYMLFTIYYRLYTRLGAGEAVVVGGRVGRGRISRAHILHTMYCILYTICYI